MAFAIHLQINTSEKEALDKEVNLIGTLTGSLKEETSIIDPVITFAGDLSLYANCNYMTIDAFHRSYFITNIRSIRNGLFEITGHVDVLSTYKSYIRANNAIIKKQALNWNLYLNDGTFKVYQTRNIVTKLFPNSFSHHTYVLAVAGP